MQSEKGRTQKHQSYSGNDNIQWDGSWILVFLDCPEFHTLKWLCCWSYCHKKPLHCQPNVSMFSSPVGAGGRCICVPVSTGLSPKHWTPQGLCWCHVCIKLYCQDHPLHQWRTKGKEGFGGWLLDWTNPIEISLVLPSKMELVASFGIQL